ncbi:MULTISPECIES: hypothetical protein [Roseobacteraceae]|uniref:Uncharacterized protein n=1 Tax=Celeribacter baekdonensis B30 TaxID=1208323 RepID=K2K2R6_9RHOB|nr:MULTISPECIES: hypothetical protein [Roseobacteraceae]EKE71775.1 hypothetical protein B30_08403 [Celeribacter baekdonensis B30]KAB6715123.1 hypothetical protein C8029_16975 [Roseobacter sp. TSBP12]|tara:strand:- start:4687 stop:5607 length:921 start_codon:yes stop_codon:yes gene_type:complete
MAFDLKKALSLPDIHRSVHKRDEVLRRFGPLFRDPSSLMHQDYLDFLSLKHNHHWSGLERLGRTAANDMDNLRSAISILVDETALLSDRFDTALSMVDGVGAATLTPMLLLAYPDRYGVWNGTSEPEMRDRGIWPSFPPNSSFGKKYEIINTKLIGLSKDLGVDLWTLDALWWVSKLERLNNGEIKDARFKAIWSMANQAEQTAKQSYGQTIERTVKNKDLRLSKEALITHLNELLDETGNHCAITGLTLQFDGSDDQLRPSLDRIDSNGHYETGNLQVVARFINFWKRDTDDMEFKRLIAIVRRE